MNKRLQPTRQNAPGAAKGSFTYPPLAKKINTGFNGLGRFLNGVWGEQDHGH